ncbi:fermentation associated protein, partial [Moniliophthora roreri]
GHPRCSKPFQPVTTEAPTDTTHCQIQPIPSSLIHRSNVNQPRSNSMSAR